MRPRPGAASHAGTSSCSATSGRSARSRAAWRAPPPRATGSASSSAAGDADVVYARTLVRDPGTGVTWVHERHPDQLHRDTVPHLATLVRRALLERAGGFDERYRICADRDLFVRLRPAAATFRFFGEAVAVFELGGASSRKDRTRLEDLRISRAHGLISPWRYAVKRALLALQGLRPRR